MNGSKRQRGARGSEVEFAMTAIVIGAIVGRPAGFVAGVSFKPKMLVMQVCGLTGATAGTLVEVGRYGWRKRKRPQVA